MGLYNKPDLDKLTTKPNKPEADKSREQGFKLRLENEIYGIREVWWLGLNP